MKVDFAKVNGLSIISYHCNKTECILFGSRRKLRKVKNFGIECNGHSISQILRCKFVNLVEMPSTQSTGFLFHLHKALLHDAPFQALINCLKLLKDVTFLASSGRESKVWQPGI